MKLFFILLQIFNLSSGRLLAPNEATFEVIRSESHLKVNSDFTSEMKHDYKIKILSEQAKEGFKIYSFSYTSDAESIEFHKVTLSNGSYTKEVPKSSFEYKDLSSGSQSFDSLKTIRIPMDGLKVGSVIHMVLTRKTLKPNVRGFFSTQYSFGLGSGYVKKQSIKVESAMPLSFKVHDPSKLIRIKNKDNKRFSFSLKRPHVFYFAEEPNYTNLNKINTTVSLSSMNTWSDFALMFQKDLPRISKKELKLIDEFIPKEKSLKIDKKVQKVVSSIISRISYLGDWKTVKGRYTPRSITKILKTGYGDCKDSSYLLHSVLDKMNIESGLALISRSNVPSYWTEKSLPLLERFNHMITWYIDGDDIYYVDPTNFTAEASRIPLDISNRPTLVLDSNKGFLSETPSISVNENTIEVTQVLYKKSNSNATLKGNVKIKGPFAMSWRNHLKPLIDIEKEQTLVNSFFDKSRFYKYQVLKMPNEKSEGASDFNFRIKGDIKPRVIKTSQGMAFYPKAFTPQMLTADSFSKSRLMDYYLSSPSTTTYNLILKNFTLKGQVPKNCSHKNNFFEFQRTFNYDKKSKELKQTDVTKVLKSSIPVNELRPNSRLFKNVIDFDLCKESIAYLY